MATYIFMIIFALLLFSVTVFRSEYHPQGNPGFFDKINAGSMRGIFSLIIIMIHIPRTYENKIQLMIGGFAYIGVTFFFLTSAYGLTLKSEKISRKSNNKNQKKFNGTAESFLLTKYIRNNSATVKNFWKSRLPKLLVPQYLCNIFFLITALLTDPSQITLKSVIGINIWVVWLLIFYFVFWLAHLLISNKILRYVSVSVFVVVLSLTGFYIRTAVSPDFLIWNPEMYGLIAGIILAIFYDKIRIFFNRNWLIKTILCGAFTLVTGVIYLKTQHIIFYGNYLLKTFLGLTIIALILLINSRISIGNKALEFLGKISFEIYLTHIGIMNFIANFFPEISSGIFISATIISTIIVSAIIHSAVEKILKITSQIQNKKA